MRCHFRILIAMAVCCIGIRAASATLCEMEYRFASSSALQTKLPFQVNRLMILTQRPESVEMGRFVSRQPLFCWWESPLLDHKKLLVALDQSRIDGPYDLLYCDGNENGSLLDEEPYRAVKEQNRRLTFGPVEVLVNTSEGKLLYHLAFQYYSTSSRQYMYVSSAGWLEGRITVGQQKLLCSLIDNNANGTFNDSSIDFRKVDHLQIGTGSRQTLFFVGKYIPLGDQLYSLTVPSDGATIRLEPAEQVPMGYVEIPEGLHECVLGGTNGLFYLRSPQGRIALPQGKYRLKEWTMQRLSHSQIWEMTGTKFGTSTLFTLSSDQVVKLPIEEPLIAELGISYRDSTYSMHQELKGNLSETISITCQGRRPDPPRLLITGARGRFRKVLAFEYG